MLLDALCQPSVRLPPHSDCVRDGLCDQLRIGHRRELDERCSIQMARPMLLGKGQGEACLADAGGPGKRQQPSSVQEVLKLGKLALSADQARDLDRQLVPCRGARGIRALSSDEQVRALGHGEIERGGKPLHRVAIGEVARAALEVGDSAATQSRTLRERLLRQSRGDAVASESTSERVRVCAPHGATQYFTFAWFVFYYHSAEENDDASLADGA